MNLKKITYFAIFLITFTSIGFYIFFGNIQDDQIVQLLIVKNMNLSEQDLVEVKGVAVDFIEKNSSENLEFSINLNQIFIDWIHLRIIPENTDLDESQMYLHRINNEWIVEGFGTSFPELFERYPEILEKSM